MLNPYKFLINKKICLLFFFAFFIKIILSQIIPVAGDETYYLLWGQNLRLSYFDHPPAVSWLTWISNQLIFFFGDFNKNLLLRLPFVFLSQMTYLVWMRILTIYIKNENEIFYFAVLYLLNPFLGFGGIFSTPDIPFLFFFSLSFYSVLKILKYQTVFWYSFLGVALGLGFCSKYHIVLFPPALIIYLIFSKKINEINWLKTFSTLFFGFACCLPVIIWNYQTNWSSFVFQLNHGLSRPLYNLIWTVGYSLGQILLFSPLLFYNLMKQKITAGKVFSLTQWCFFLLSSFKALVEANWPIAAHFTGLLSLKLDKKIFRLTLKYWCLIWLCLFFFLFSNYGQKKMSSFPQSIAAQEIYEETKNFRPLWGPTYQMSSLLSFVSNEKIFKLNGLSRLDFYDSLDESKPIQKKYYVLKYKYSDWPENIKNDQLTLIKNLKNDQLELFQVNKNE